MQLMNRVISFLDITSMPKTKFCQRAGLSPITLHKWLRGEIIICAKTSNKISNFIDEFILKVKEI